MYIYMYIYTIFVNEILAGIRSPDDLDLPRFAAPIKIAQTLARYWFWSFLDPPNRSIVDRQTFIHTHILFFDPQNWFWNSL